MCEREVAQSCPTVSDRMDCSLAGSSVHGISCLETGKSTGVGCHCLLCRPPCPSPTPGAYSDSCPSSRWCHPAISSSVVLFSSCLQCFPTSKAFPFFSESVLRIRWPKYWSFSFNISPSDEYSGLISFTMDRLDLFAVQGTRKSLLQNHSSKVSILQLSAFFIVQLSHPHMTSWKHCSLLAKP